jgi:hypothetical protein
VPALRSIQAQIDPLLDQAVLRALELQPAERYQSVEELRHALEAATLLRASMPEPQPAAPYTAEAAPDAEAMPFAAEQSAADSALLSPVVPPAAQDQNISRSTSGTMCLFITAAALLVAVVLIGGVLFYFIFGPGGSLLS